MHGRHTPNVGMRNAAAGEELWKNCRRIVETFCARLLGGEELWKNYSTIIPCQPLSQRTRKHFLQFFHNSSTIFPCKEEFGASGLAWERIIEGIIVE
jgi:hypothetical protein